MFGFLAKDPNKLGTPLLGIKLCTVPQISELYPPDEGFRNLHEGGQKHRN